MPIEQQHHAEQYLEQPSHKPENPEKKELTEIEGERITDSHEALTHTSGGLEAVEKATHLKDTKEKTSALKSQVIQENSIEHHDDSLFSRFTDVMTDVRGEMLNDPDIDNAFIPDLWDDIDDRSRRLGRGFSREMLIQRVKQIKGEYQTYIRPETPRTERIALFREAMKALPTSLSIDAVSSLLATRVNRPTLEQSQALLSDLVRKYKELTDEEQERIKQLTIDRLTERFAHATIDSYTITIDPATGIITLTLIDAEGHKQVVLIPPDIISNQSNDDNPLLSLLIKHLGNDAMTQLKESLVSTDDEDPQQLKMSKI